MQSIMKCPLEVNKQSEKIWVGNVDHVVSQVISQAKRIVLNVKKLKVMQSIMKCLLEVKKREKIWVGDVVLVDSQEIFPRELNVLNVKNQKVMLKIMNYLFLLITVKIEMTEMTEINMIEEIDLDLMIIKEMTDINMIEEMIGEEEIDLDLDLMITEEGMIVIKEKIIETIIK